MVTQLFQPVQLSPAGAQKNTPKTEAKTLQGERFKIGVNSKIIGKVNPDKLSYAGAWETREFTIEELADWAGNQGHPWMMATLNGGRRIKANVLEAQVIALDVDNTGVVGKDADNNPIKVYKPYLTIEQAKAHPYIKARGAAIVPSASHTDDWHKFRLMFILPTPAIGVEAIEAALGALMEIFPGADSSCKDGTRFFFAATHGIAYINPEARLPEDFLPKAIEAEREKWRLIEEEQERYRLALKSMDVSIAAQHARDAWACIPPRQKDTGTYLLYRDAIIGTINDLGAEGEAIVLAADPMRDAYKGGTAGFIRSITRSRSTKRATLKSLYYLAKDWGYKFEPTQEERSAYGKANFTAEQRREYAIAKGWIQAPAKGFAVITGGKTGEPTPAEMRDRQLAKRKMQLEGMSDLLALDYKLIAGETIEYQSGIYTLIDLEVLVRYGGFAPQPKIDDIPRTTLIQGGLGSGKTEAFLRAIIESAAGRQVVVMAHRNGLLRGTMQRLQVLAKEAGVYLFTVFYQDEVAKAKEMMLTGEPGVFLFAPDTLKDYSVGDTAFANAWDGTGVFAGMKWSNTVVILDEFSAIRKEILSKSKSFPHFAKCLTDAHTVIAVDRYLGNMDYSILKEYRPTQIETIYQQNPTKEKKRINFIQSRTKAGEISLSLLGCFEERLRHRIKENMKRGLMTPVATDCRMAAHHAKQIAESLMEREHQARLLKIEREHGQAVKVLMEGREAADKAAKKDFDQAERQSIDYWKNVRNLAQIEGDSETLNSIKEGREKDKRQAQKALAQKRHQIAQPYEDNLKALGFKYSAAIAQAEREWAERPQTSIKVALTSSVTIDDNKQMLPDPTNYYARMQVNVAIITPTLQAGGDIQTPCGTGVAYFIGTIAPTDQVQMMGRFRHCKEWDIICPHHSPARMTGKKDLESIIRWAEKTGNRLNSLGVGGSDFVNIWAQWERAMQSIGKHLGREWLELLCRENYADVQTIEIEVDPDVALAQNLEWAEIKRDEARLVMTANRANGANLLARNKQPQTTQQVWDMALAKFQEAYPELAPKVFELFGDGASESAELAIEQYVALTHDRMNRLKWYLIAESDQSVSHLETWIKVLDANGQSASYNARRMIALYKELGLKSLARCLSKGQKVAPDEYHFCHESKEIRLLHKRFQRSAELTEYFPEVETLKGFWDLIRRCMRFMGFEQASGGTARTKTEELHPNGKYKGQQRFSPSASIHYSGWVIMEQSGNKVTRSLMPQIFADKAKVIAADAIRTERYFIDNGFCVEEDIPPDIPISA